MVRQPVIHRRTLSRSEEPLELQLAYGAVGSRQVKSISVTARTPGHDFELAAGFLLTEGIVSDSADIRKHQSFDPRINAIDNTPTGSALWGTIDQRAAQPKTVQMDDLFDATSLLGALIQRWK